MSRARASVVSSSTLPIRGVTTTPSPAVSMMDTLIGCTRWIEPTRTVTGSPSVYVLPYWNRSASFSVVLMPDLGRPSASASRAFRSFSRDSEPQRKLRRSANRKRGRQKPQR